MDKLTHYQKLACQIVEEVASKLASSGNVESLLSTDNQHGQYLVLSDSWDGIKRNYGPLVHIEIKPDAKVWLRYDGTDLEIGQQLLDRGVLASDLVLAFHSPQMRKYTAFATT